MLEDESTIRFYQTMLGARFDYFEREEEEIIVRSSMSDSDLLEKCFPLEQVIAFSSMVIQDETKFFEGQDYELTSTLREKLEEGKRSESGAIFDALGNIQEIQYLPNRNVRKQKILEDKFKASHERFYVKWLPKGKAPKEGSSYTITYGVSPYVKHSFEISSKKKKKGKDKDQGGKYPVSIKDRYPVLNRHEVFDASVVVPVSSIDAVNKAFPFSYAFILENNTNLKEFQTAIHNHQEDRSVAPQKIDELSPVRKREDISSQHCDEDLIVPLYDEPDIDYSTKHVWEIITTAQRTLGKKKKPGLLQHWKDKIKSFRDDKTPFSTASDWFNNHAFCENCLSWSPFNSEFPDKELFDEQELTNKIRRIKSERCVKCDKKALLHRSVASSLFYGS